MMDAMEIPLTQSKVTLVDEDDFAGLSSFSWCLHKDGYAIRYATTSYKKQTAILMHRFLCGDPENMEIDHINGNRLDNRRSNLRIVTKQQNQWNASGKRNSSSRHKGVWFHKRSGKWESAITINGKQKYLGSFISEDSAALAYNQAAKVIHGVYARLNRI